MSDIDIERLARALCAAKHGPDTFADPRMACRGTHRRKAARLVAEYERLADCSALVAAQRERDREAVLAAVAEALP